ncbi:Hsp20/alpha crystallin family protein [Massilia sp. PAMC28688]|nr:Hsp20/alpha crystallin family protein [Massilia sp. PAMC28688]
MAGGAQAGSAGAGSSGGGDAAAITGDGGPGNGGQAYRGFEQGGASGVGAVQTGTGSQSGQLAGRTAGVLRPPVDVIEDAQGITLLADMPGVTRDNLNLRLDSQSLTIEGAMALDIPQQMEGRYIEVGHQHYERTFALSRELDGAQATAELNHGVLKIRIPKTQEAAPRKIPVNSVQP